MSQKINPFIQAVDLMLEDLHIKHGDIREQAKEYNCEKQLDEIKKSLILYLQDIKSQY